MEESGRQEHLLQHLLYSTLLVSTRLHSSNALSYSVPVSSCHDNDAIVAGVQAVHAGQYLIQSVFLLTVHRSHTTRPEGGVEKVV